MTSADILIVMLCYTFQIYFDFSGYCDMASGIANLFNVKLPNNFNSPYKATDILGFWSRWHMSLTGFLRKYVYFPLGGSKKGTIRKYANILIVFFISGIWHGANWTFILWGLIHGVANVLNRLFLNTWKKLTKGIQWSINFIFINITWLLFRSDNCGQFFQLLKNIYIKMELHISKKLYESFQLFEFSYIEEHLPSFLRWNPNVYMWVFIIGSLLGVLFLKNCNEIKSKPTLFNAGVVIFLLLWCVLSLSGMSTFLYFNF